MPDSEHASFSFMPKADGQSLAFFPHSADGARTDQTEEPGVGDVHSACVLHWPCWSPPYSHSIDVPACDAGHDEPSRGAEGVLAGE